MNSLTAYSIPLSASHLLGCELSFSQEIDPINWPSLVPQFENKLCAASGAAFAVATPSGTAALELALRTLNVGPGDLVICPSLTFVATANAILGVRATPVFVGSESTTWGLDPDALETALKNLPNRPKAIIVVDLYGMPARWDDLQTVADRHDIPLVADAAESLGSLLNGQHCGTMGLLNAVSFNQNKIITTMGGGVLLTSNQAVVAKARLIANQGRQTEPPFAQQIAGSNYRMNPVEAGIGLCQLSVLAERVTQRRAIFEQYRVALHQQPGLCFQPERVGAKANRWLTALTIDPGQTGVSRDQVAQALRQSGIETRPVFPPLHKQTIFRGCAFYGSSLTDELPDNGLCLPSGSGLSVEAIDTVTEGIKTKLGCR
jgi:pyridoxal phosphate-dependent aminotransferase EpsN